MKRLVYQPERRPLLRSVLGLVLVLSGCFHGGLDQATALARPTVEAFHAGYNRQDCGALYASADSGFRQLTGRSAFVALCESTYRRVGSVSAVQLITRKIGVTPFGRTLTLEYGVTYARGRGREVFLLRPVGVRYGLIGYSIELE